MPVAAGLFTPLQAGNVYLTHHSPIRTGKLGLSVSAAFINAAAGAGRSLACARVKIVRDSFISLKTAYRFTAVNGGLAIAVF